MACCTARQVRMKKISTQKATAKANQAVAKGKKAGIKPKKIHESKKGTKPTPKKTKGCTPCVKKKHVVTGKA